MSEGEHIQPALLESFAAGECLLPAVDGRHLAACSSCSMRLARAARLELAMVETAQSHRDRRARRNRALGVGVVLGTASLIVASLFLPLPRLRGPASAVPFVASPRDHHLDVSREAGGVPSLQHLPGVEVPDSPGAIPAEETIDRSLPGIVGTEGSDT